MGRMGAPGAMALASILLGAAPAVAGPPTAAAPAASSVTDIKPAAERSVAGGPAKKPVRSAGNEGVGSSGQPAIRGPKLPEALRKQLQARLDARVESDLSKSKELRAEAIDLLTKFVAETPREAREMPEALVRLASCSGRTSASASSTASPSGTRGRSTSAVPRRSRLTASRAICSPACSRTTRGSTRPTSRSTSTASSPSSRARRTRRWTASSASCASTRSRASCPTRTWPRPRRIFNGQLRLPGRAHRVREGPVVQGQDRSVAVRPRALQERLVLLAPGQQRRGREALRRRLRGHRRERRRQARERGRAEAARRAARARRSSTWSRCSPRTRRTPPRTLYNFLTKIGGERFAGKIVRALAEQYYDQAHYERGIEAYELLLKLEPTSRDAGRWVLQIAAGYAALEDYPQPQDDATTARSPSTRRAARGRARRAIPANVARHHGGRSSRRCGRTRSRFTPRRSRTRRAAPSSRARWLCTTSTSSKFDKEPKAYEMQFSVGEIDFFRLERNVDAATHYMAAAKGIPATDEDRAARRHAARRALQRPRRRSRATCDARQRGARRARTTRPSRPRPTRSSPRRSTSTRSYYPNDPQLPRAVLPPGQATITTTRVYDSAVKIWGIAAREVPQQRAVARRRRAASSTRSTARRTTRTSRPGRAASRRCRRSRAPTQQERLDALIVQAVFKQGEQKAAAGDHAAAAAAYLRAAKEFPKDPRAAQACVNAELEAQEGGDVTTLKEAAPARDGPGVPRQAGVSRRRLDGGDDVAGHGPVRRRGRHRRAMASLGDRDHPNYAKYEHAKDAPTTPSSCARRPASTTARCSTAPSSSQTYGSAAEADEVVFQMGRAHQNAGRDKDAAELYKRYITRAKNLDHRAQGCVLLAQAQIKIGDERGAAASLDDAVTLGKKRNAGPDRRGQVRRRPRPLHAGRAGAREVRADHHPGRREAAQGAPQAEDRAAQGSREGVPRLRVARRRRVDDRGALPDRPHVRGVRQVAARLAPAARAVKTDDQKADYQSQIEEFAVPIEERSLDAYENGWKKALDLGIYNQWTAKMRDALGRLNSELYPPFKETGFEVRSQGPLPLPALIDAPNRPVAAVAPPPVKK